MTQINQALGVHIIEGGLRRVEDDTRLYGNAAAVVLANARLAELLHEVGQKSGADVFRRTLATKLGELAVSALYSGDFAAILERGIADIARLAPLVDLQERAANREQAEANRKAAADEIERQINSAITDGTETREAAE